MQHRFRHAITPIGAVLAVVAVAGCGGSSGSGATGGGSGSSPAATQQAAALNPTDVPTFEPATKEVANVTWNLIYGEPQTLDAARVLNYGDEEVLSNLCEPLEYLMPDGSRQPALAESIDAPDKTTYVIKVRQGVKFWDGKPLTAEDVAYSLNRVRDPKTASFYGGLAAAVKSIEATGPDTVTVKMSKPDVLYREMLVSPLGMVTEKAYTEAKGNDYGTPQGGVMCTGPYELDKWSPGSQITVKRNPDWWNAANRKQWPAAAKFTFVTDPQTVTSALTSGEIDGAFDVPPAALTPLQTTQAGKLLTGPSTVVIAFATLSQQGAIGSVKIRQAVGKLIDYEGYAKSQYNDTAVPSRALMGPNAWVGAEDTYKAAYSKLPEAKQDIAAAKTLVAQSGIKNPVVRIAAFSGLPQEAALASQIQSSAKQAGLKVTFDNLPLAEFTTLFSSAKQRAKYDLMLQFSGADAPDAFEFYQSVGLKNGVNNLSGWSDPTVTKLLTQAQAEPDPAKRAELTVQAQTIITEQAPWIPAVFPNFTAFVNNRLAGVSTSFPSVAYTPWLPDVGAR